MFGTSDEVLGALESGKITLNYSGYESKISILEPLVGQSGWLELSKLTIEALNTDEFLIFAAQTESVQVLDEEICGKLLLLPGQLGDLCSKIPDLSVTRQTEIQAKLDTIDKRNGEFFDEEVLKLDRWSEDLAGAGAGNQGHRQANPRGPQDGGIGAVAAG